VSSPIESSRLAFLLLFFAFRKGVSMRKLQFFVAGLALAGCSSGHDIATVKPNVTSDIGSSAVTMLTESAAERHARLPSGTRIYHGTTLMVQDGSSAASFPGDATYQRDEHGLVVTYAGKTHIFAASATLSVRPGAEYYIYPGRLVPQAVKRLRYETVGAR
jgi:hypothetical protein